MRVASSPRLTPGLVGTVRRLALDEALSAAEIWRRASVAAESRGLYRPSYHSVLLLVHETRERRPLDLVVFAGILVRPPRVRLGVLGRRRRVRDDSSRRHGRSLLQLVRDPFRDRERRCRGR